VLAAAVDVRRWLQDDRQTPFAERLTRDRAIGRLLDPDADEAARVLSWWARIQAQGAGAVPAVASSASLGMRVVRYRRMAGIVLTLLGAALGAAVAGVAFAYDGRHPVNLFTLFGILVAFPAIMLLLTLALLPARPVRPGGVLAALNAARWAGAALDRLLGAELFAPGFGAPAGLAGFARWQLLVFSQWLAVGFFVGALLLALLRVTFTDLAFGWSTTLQIAAVDVHRWLAGLALPWARWLPQAVPDLSLIEASRYFRGGGNTLDEARAARLGDWWPFVFMVISVYGLAPRLLLLAAGSWRLQRATRGLLCNDSEVTALLDRLTAPMVVLGGDREEQGLPASTAATPAPEGMSAQHEALVVVWNEALAEPALRAWLDGWLGARLQVRAAAVLALDARASERAQRDALVTLAAEHGGTPAARRLIVVTRGWEPPLLEFNDFLGLIRELLGMAPSITVVPIDVSGTRVAPAEREVWAKTLARLRDPRLYVQEPLE